LLRIVGAVLALGYLLPMMPATPIRASAEAAATRDGGAPSSVPAGAGGNRPSLPQIFEMANNPGGAGALPGSPQANLVLGYRLLNEAGNLPWDRIREKRTLLEQALGAARAAGDPTLEYRVGFFLASVLRQVKKNAGPPSPKPSANSANTVVRIDTNENPDAKAAYAPMPRCSSWV